MKKHLTIFILICTCLITTSCKSQSKNNKSPEKCYTPYKTGMYHIIPTKAFSYINDNGDLKWVYCDSLVRKTIRIQQWPINCKTGERLSMSVIEDGFPVFIDRSKYYLHNKVVKPIEIIKDLEEAEYYTGYWKVNQ